MASAMVSNIFLNKRSRPVGSGGEQGTLPLWACVDLVLVSSAAPWCSSKGFLVFHETEPDVTECLQLIFLLNSDYSCLTADFCWGAPTSGFGKSCSGESSYMKVFLQGSFGEVGKSSGWLTILSIQPPSIACWATRAQWMQRFILRKEFELEGDGEIRRRACPSLF